MDRWGEVFRQMTRPYDVLLPYTSGWTTERCPHCEGNHFAIADDGQDTYRILCWCGASARADKEDEDIVAVLFTLFPEDPPLTEEELETLRKTARNVTEPHCALRTDLLRRLLADRDRLEHVLAHPIEEDANG